MRLINADELIEHVWRDRVDSRERIANLIESMPAIKETIPAADVVPVVHGRWMCVPEMWGIFSSRYYCSKCGKDAIINNSERYILSDYCPHCGSFNGGKNEV